MADDDENEDTQEATETPSPSKRVRTFSYTPGRLPRYNSPPATPHAPPGQDSGDAPEEALASTTFAVENWLNDADFAHVAIDHDANMPTADEWDEFMDSIVNELSEGFTEWERQRNDTQQPGGTDAPPSAEDCAAATREFLSSL
ncbi:hypothetical protein MBLNU457_3537t1 [Dothideomycetes sp. NU457]